jgi:hypothetical protein
LRVACLSARRRRCAVLRRTARGGSPALRVTRAAGHSLLHGLSAERRPAALRGLLPASHNNGAAVQQPQQHQARQRRAAGRRLCKGSGAQRARCRRRSRR